MIKTINLEASVALAKSKLRDLLDDPADLFKRFDEAVAVSHLSASGGEAAGLAAGSAIVDYAWATDDANCVSNVNNVICAFVADLRVWYNEAHRMERAFRRNWRDSNICNSCVARWESRGGRYWVELWHGPTEYRYASAYAGCGSVCSPHAPLVAAVTVMQSKLERGCFLPNVAKLPMKRVS